MLILNSDYNTNKNEKQKKNDTYVSRISFHRRSRN